MKFCVVSACLLSSTIYAFSAYQQQLVPIIREINVSSAPSVSEWHTFVRMADYEGTSYVSLVQIAELLNGHLRWRPMAKGVDLSIHNQTIRFGDNSSQASINGRTRPLDHPTIKNEDGFWVPISFFASPVFYKATKTKLEWPPHDPVEGKTQRVERGGSKKSTAQTSEVPSTLHPPLSTKAIKRIVIDPGHGGKDPGAVGPHGVEEKTINLQLSQELADVLREKHDYEVLLTRMDDTFVPLDERSRLANRHNADLFVSIHCNASLSSKLKGFEVYFLSEEASDPHADAVARFENAPLALEGRRVPTQSQVKVVLRSLVKTANINEASALGALMDRHMGERLSEPSLGVKQAAFYVLRGAEMPAALIETGFISNPKEEKLLQDSAFRKKLIEGIAGGISAYDERKQKERR